MSFPHISGIVALLRSVDRDWLPTAIKWAMMTTTYDLDNTATTNPIANLVSSSGGSISAATRTFTFSLGGRVQLPVNFKRGCAGGNETVRWF
ncbi:unnamed protein product [Linum trigynum]|uniref:Peptidase S8/S53 domain-containing protein n=1 Tax=Linum trigynum TaxID=586398 RepID=A0AAV2FF88_9ROSI